MKVKTTEILWSKINQNAIIPTKNTEDAGYDIYACFDEDLFIIPPHETKLIPTGIASAINEKYYFQIEERGSTGSKGIKKSAGVFDSGYRGEWLIAVTNINSKPIVIAKKDAIKNINDLKLDDIMIIYPYEKAIAQAVLQEVPNVISKEIPYDELLKYESKRKDTKLGQSGK